MERALREAAAEGGCVVAVGEGDGAGTLRQALARCLGTPARPEQPRPRPRRGRLRGARTRGARAGGAAGARAAGRDGPGCRRARRARPARGDRRRRRPRRCLPCPRPPVSLARAHLLPRLAEASAGPVVLARTLRLVGLDVGAAEAQLQTALRGAGRRERPRGRDRRGVLGAPPACARTRRRGARRRSPRSSPRSAAPSASPGTASTTRRSEAVVGRLLRARRLHRRPRRVLHGRARGPPAHPGVRAARPYFERGFVVYSNEAKAGAPRRAGGRCCGSTGPCPPPRADAMARAGAERAGTDIGVSITGIAGPDGGTPTKPVGTVFVGLADAAGRRRRALSLRPRPGGQQGALRTSALDLLRRRCLAASLSARHVSLSRRPVSRSIARSDADAARGDRARVRDRECPRLGRA